MHYDFFILVRIHLNSSILLPHIYRLFLFYVGKKKQNTPQVKHPHSVVTHLVPFTSTKNTDTLCLLSPGLSDRLSFLTHQQGPLFITKITAVFEALATHWTDSLGPIFLQIFVIFSTIHWMAISVFIFLPEQEAKYTNLYLISYI